MHAPIAHCAQILSTVVKCDEAGPQSTTSATPPRAPGPDDGPDGCRRLAQEVVGLLLALLVLGVLLTYLEPLHALYQAGAFGDRGAEIRGVRNFVDYIRGNVIWLAGCFVGLALAVVAFMFLSGHSRAQDYLIRGGIGITIFAGLGGILN